MDNHQSQYYVPQDSQETIEDESDDGNTVTVDELMVLVQNDPTSTNK